jgi:hypothetical protein
LPKKKTEYKKKFFGLLLSVCEEPTRENGAVKAKEKV